MRIRSTLLIPIVAFGLAILAAFTAIAMIRSTPFYAQSDESMLKELRSYREWTKVNPRRQRMAIPVMLLCTYPPRLDPWRTGLTYSSDAPDAIRADLSSLVPIPRNDTDRLPQNPHDTNYITVFVNPIGSDAMMTQDDPKFPVGSIIVKEKFTTLDSPEPVLLTVMKKRETGYDVTRGDWEYMVVDGAMSTIGARGTLGTCQSCHLEKADQDFVFRTYLPVEDAGMMHR